MCDVLNFVTPPRNLRGQSPSQASLMKGPRPKKRLPEGSYHERDYNLGGCSFLASWHKYIDDDSISFEIVKQDHRVPRKPLRSTKAFENSVIRRRLFQREPVATKVFSPDEGCFSDEDSSSPELASQQKPSKKSSGLSRFRSNPLLPGRSSETCIRPEARSNSFPAQPRPKQLLHQFSGSRLSNKTCSSCGTRKTPLWRDSEDGTPYCNACGIRYRKYKTSCGVCKYVPRKDACSSGLCCRCRGALVKC